MKLSIIIPAYNAEEYIEHCLLSLHKQNIEISDYEIIVVDDGSTDHTAKKVLHIAENYKNIHLETQKNKGNGGARNTGIDIAKGTYLYFLDADDYIAENTLGTLVDLLEQNNLDIIMFSSKMVNNSEQHYSKNANEKISANTILNGIDFIGSYNYQAEVWRYISRRSFFLNTKLRFYDRKFVQDSYLTPTLFSKAQRICFIDYDVHRYRKSRNSITRNTSRAHLETHFKDLVFAIKQLYNLRHQLIEEGITNNEALLRLHVKQQWYVFIVIVRFVRSRLKSDYLKTMLKDFEVLEAYPMHIITSNSDYRNLLYRIAIFIFNRKKWLFFLISVYRRIRP